MITTPAIIRAKSGQTSPVTATLLEVAAHLDADEPETKSFHIMRDRDDDRVRPVPGPALDHALCPRHQAGTVDLRAAIHLVNERVAVPTREFVPTRKFVPMPKKGIKSSTGALSMKRMN